MENFNKVTYVVENGVATINEALMPRSIVVLNKRGYGFNAAAKCRNTDRKSVLKALTKIVFAEMHETYAKNSQESVRISGNSGSGDHVSKVLGCSFIAVTDKNGHILTDSILNVTDTTVNGKLKDLFKIDKKKGMYQRCVLSAPDWNDEATRAELEYFVESAVANLDYVKRLDEAIAEAADSNYEEAAAEVRAKWEATHPATPEAPTKKSRGKKVA